MLSYYSITRLKFQEPGEIEILMLMYNFAIRISGKRGQEDHVTVTAIEAVLAKVREHGNFKYMWNFMDMPDYERVDTSYALSYVTFPLNPEDTVRRTWRGRQSIGALRHRSTFHAQMFSFSQPSYIASHIKKLVKNGLLTREPAKWEKGRPQAACPKLQKAYPMEITVICEEERLDPDEKNDRNCAQKIRKKRHFEDWVSEQSLLGEVPPSE